MQQLHHHKILYINMLRKKTDKFTPLNPKIIKFFLLFLIKLRKFF